MHELVKNEKKESRARPLRHHQQQQQPRTGPITSCSSSSSTSSNSKRKDSSSINNIEKQQQQQKRIAARAATAMAQVLQRSNHSRRRREPRSLLMWGDRKKAVIKSYPDGGQEIIVPQTLTPEQEHYEFPPRSRFLKKLATSTAERSRRLSSLIIQPTTIIDDNNMKSSPDQLALQEWFSKKQKTTSRKVSQSNRAVIDWMNDVERHSKTLIVKASPTPSSYCSTNTTTNNNKIQFKSDAGKRWANSITANTSLLPPDDHCRKHYVPRRLLLLSTQKKPGYPIEQEKEEVDVTEAASKIQSMWKEYQANKHNNHRSTPMIENQIGITAMASTGQRTPIAGMVHLLHMLQNSLKKSEQRAHDRMEQLELLLKEERHKRQSAEENMKKLLGENDVLFKEQPSLMEKEKMYQTLLLRVAELEDLIKKREQEEVVRSTRSKDQLELKKKTTTLSKSKRSSIVPSNNTKHISSTSKRSSVVPTSSLPPTTKARNVPTTKKSSIVPSNNTSRPPRRSLARTSSLANAGVVVTNNNTSSRSNNIIKK